MKKLFLIAAMLLFVTVVFNVQAQEKGSKAAGANLVIGSGDGFSNFGLGVKFLYGVTDNIRGQAEFDYYLKKDYITMWDLSAYGQYLFPVTDVITVYPEVGLGIVNTGVDLGGFGSASSSDLALSLGGGLDYALQENIDINAGLRFKMYDGSRLNIYVGLAYKF